MDIILSPTEVWQIAVIKLLFYLFIGLGLILFFKLKKPILLVTLIAAFLATTYLVLIYQAKVTWWGLQGDEIFVTAFLEKVAFGQPFSDFFYSGLPPFYPPLYFWLIGGLAFLFKLNGVGAAQLGVAIVLFVLPFLVYFWSSYTNKTLADQQNSDKGSSNKWKLVLAPAIVFIVADWTTVITKPYEFISAVLIVFWLAFLLCDLHFKLLNFKKILFYGVSGGLLFLTFYFWFFPLVLAITLFKLLTPTKIWYYYSRLFLVGALVILISLPYILPLLFSYWKFGLENWQPAFFTIQSLDLFLPFFQFSIFGLVSLVGLLSIIFYWSKPHFKALGVILVSLYLWQFISLITITFRQAPFLPDKPFVFFGGAVLAISAAYGLSEFLETKLKNKSWQSAIFVLAWLILATQLLGGSFIDSPMVRNQLIIMKQPLREELVNLIEELKNVPDLEKLTILSSGVPQLSAYLPFDYYVSYNIHFSHPAANFSQRYYFISELAASRSPEDFAKNLRNSPFEPIDALLLYKSNQSYPIFFWLDDYPLGGKEGTIEIPSSLISEQYYTKIFEDKNFVFYMVKT